MNIISRHAAERYDICKQCDSFKPTLKVCGECNCWLPGKTKLEFASCPLYKWPGEVKPKSKAELEKELAERSR